MPVGKKLAVVLTVVVAGASVALFFRKDASQLKFWQTGPEDPFGRPVERRVKTDTARTQRGPSAKAISQRGAAQRVGAAATAAISEPKGLGPDSQPRFQKNLNPVGALLPPIEGVVGEDEPDSFGESNSLGKRHFAPTSDATRHVVVDGDTLSSLAVRYLGRAEAYLEIFEFNRDVLASPDLLPIGAVLRIPPQRAPGVVKGPHGIAQVGAELEPESPLKMVPLRATPGRNAP